MSLLSCLRCATRFAVGLLHCPHCLSEEFEEDGVPKNTTWGGASYPAEAAAGSGEPEAVAPAAEVVTEPEPAPEPEPKPKAKPEPTEITGEGSVVVPKPEAF